MTVRMPTQDIAKIVGSIENSTEIIRKEIIEAEHQRHNVECGRNSGLSWKLGSEPDIDESRRALLVTWIADSSLCAFVC